MEEAVLYRTKWIDRKATGSLIRNAISDAGLTVLEASEYLGLETPRILYRWFRGDSLPNIDRFAALSAITGLSIDDLIAVRTIPLSSAGDLPRAGIKKREKSSSLLFEYPHHHSEPPISPRKTAIFLLYRHELLKTHAAGQYRIKDC